MTDPKLISMSPEIISQIGESLAERNGELKIASEPTTPSVDEFQAYDEKETKSLENDSLMSMLSLVYAKLLIVMGVCFPLGEVISKRIPIYYYEGFYLYLYIGSITFILFVYIFLLRPEKEPEKKSRFSILLHALLKTMDTVPRRNSTFGVATTPPVQKIKVDNAAHCGSFYVRLSAVAFGIGSMIYSGLEFGQFFELHSDSECYNVLFALTPFTRTAFAFVQMYFLFLNSTMVINKYKTLSRFGLMHVIAANLCIWLHVLVQETKHGMVNFNNSSAVIEEMPHIINASLPKIFSSSLYVSHECRRSNIMGKLVQDASQFLFPCVIEHSLISAATLYMMWKSIGQSYPRNRNGSVMPMRSNSMVGKQRHYYQVDCAKANKGLFTGIFVLAMCIISIIIFFVFLGRPETRYSAIIETRITELVLHVMTALAVAVAMYQIRELKYIPSPGNNIELDNYLLVVGQSGLYLFTMFGIIGAVFGEDDKMGLVLLSSIAGLVQSTLQTLFIFDASKRQACTSVQMQKKPAREMVTFLLLCNFAMWAITTLETQRPDSNPVELRFYGVLAWTVIVYVTTPLAIYFRFHSTVCLCDIWKKAYKVKHEYP